MFCSVLTPRNSQYLPMTRAKKMFLFHTSLLKKETKRLKYHKAQGIRKLHAIFGKNSKRTNKGIISEDG